MIGFSNPTPIWFICSLWPHWVSLKYEYHWRGDCPETLLLPITRSHFSLTWIQLFWKDSRLFSMFLFWFSYVSGFADNISLTCAELWEWHRKVSSDPLTKKKITHKTTSLNLVLALSMMLFLWSSWLQNKLDQGPSFIGRCFGLLVWVL